MRGRRRLAAVALAFLLPWAAAPRTAWTGEEAEAGGTSLKDLIDRFPFAVHGFWEARGGLRTQNDARQSKTATVAETRLQLEVSKLLEWAEFRAKSDFFYDDVLSEGETDLREAYAIFTPFDFADVKVGRQVLTWGTGDLVFINDLFPKDFRSFFIGRDDEYLKAPSDAARISLFHDWANLDLVYSARFRADRFPDGQRLSYWNSLLGRRAGEADRLRYDEPDQWLEDDEVAARLYRNLGGYELALYGYHGYWPTPEGFDPIEALAVFPKLDVYGASARGAVLKGIGNIEAGYYRSRDDEDGDDPFVRNSELRLLVGYTQEIGRDFTAGLQYYLEYMLDHDEYRDGLPPGTKARDKDRHVATLRLTKLLWSQNLRLSLFAFYSPSDQDAYLRPKVHYKIDDHWAIEAGGNLFVGEEDHTFFAQFERNTNVYAGVRFSF